MKLFKSKCVGPDTPKIIVVTKILLTSVCTCWDYIVGFHVMSSLKLMLHSNAFNFFYEILPSHTLHYCTSLPAMCGFIAQLVEP